VTAPRTFDPFWIACSFLVVSSSLSLSIIAIVIIIINIIIIIIITIVITGARAFPSSHRIPSDPEQKHPSGGG